MVEPGTMLVPKCTEINDTKINNIKMNARSGIESNSPLPFWHEGSVLDENLMI